MNILQFGVTLVTLLGLLVLAVPISRLTRLPTATVQVLLGAISASLLISLGYDTGLRYQNFHDLVIYLFLPILVFEAAYALDVQKLQENIAPVLTLAIVGLLLTTGLVGVCVYFAIDHSSGFPWAAALLTGSLLAATDPAAVTAQLKLSSAPKTLAVLLEGESLFNDATAVVLFTILLSLALSFNAADPMTGAGPIENVLVDGLLIFGREFFGGVLLGGVIGFICITLIGYLDDTNTRHWLSVVAALGGYILALELHVSGVLVCLVIGLLMAKYRRQEEDALIWENWATTINGVLFLLMGITLTAAMFRERYLAMLIGIGAVVLARLLSVYVSLSWSGRLSNSDKLLISTTGMRGGITLALALTLPPELPYWWTIQSIAYGVVIFDLCLTAPIMPFIVRQLTTTK